VNNAAAIPKNGEMPTATELALTRMGSFSGDMPAF
jgi:hypothetical protein